MVKSYLNLKRIARHKNISWTLKKIYFSFNFNQIKGVIKSMYELDSSMLAVLTTKTDGNERSARLVKMNGQKK